MKTPFIFCYVLFHLTACVFAWNAETNTGFILGHLVVVAGLVFFVKKTLGKIF